MLTFFRTNQQLANIFLLIYLVILHISVWVHPPTVAPVPHGVLTQLLYHEVPPLSMVAHIAVFGLVFLQAVFINIMMARYRVSSEISMLPGLFYCLIASAMPEFLTLSPVLLANTFLILATLYLFETYKNTYVASKIFDVGLWLGVASLFDLGYIVFFFWGIVGLGSLRGLQLKELLMYVLGLFVPYFLFGTYLFWTDKLYLLSEHFYKNIAFLNFANPSSATVYIKAVFIAILLIICIFSSNGLLSKRNIASQKYISIIFWMLLISGFSVLILRGIDINLLMITAVPLGILFSMLFLRVGPATAEALHMLLLAVALILQFEYLLLA